MSTINKRNKHDAKRKQGQLQPDRSRSKKAASPVAKGVTNYPVTESGELLPFLLQTLSKQSRNSVKSILTRGQVTVDGRQVTRHDHPLSPGQVVGILSNREAIKKTALSGIAILHEDEDIIVINKDAGVLSIAAKDPTEMTAYRQLTQYVRENNRNNRIFVVHRLDRDTSGVMLYARSEAVKEALQKNWQETVEERIYTALVEGVVPQEEGTLTSWLTESKTTKVHSSSYDNGGKLAITHYKKLQGNADYTLLEVQLETGRKNQIRVHMEELGHPIVGDRKYGAKTNPLQRLGLHATTLALVHPRTGKLVRFTAPVPKAFLKHSR